MFSHLVVVFECGEKIGNEVGDEEIINHILHEFYSAACEIEGELNWHEDDEVHKAEYREKVPNSTEFRFVVHSSPSHVDQLVPLRVVIAKWVQPLQRES